MLASYSWEVSLGYVKLDPVDYNSCIPVLLRVTFIPGAHEDRRSVICQLRRYQVARNSVNAYVTSSHSQLVSE